MANERVVRMSVQDRVRAESIAKSTMALHDQLPDLMLMEHIRDRAVVALGELVDRYQSWAFGLATRVLDDCLAAEEAVSRAFQMVCLYAERYNPAHFAVSDWLLGLVARCCDGLRVTRLASSTACAVDARGLEVSLGTGPPPHDGGSHSTMRFPHDTTTPGRHTEAHPW